MTAAFEKFSLQNNDSLQQKNQQHQRQLQQMKFRHHQQQQCIKFFWKKLGTMMGF